MSLVSFEREEVSLRTIGVMSRAYAAAHGSIFLTEWIRPASILIAMLLIRRGARVRSALYTLRVHVLLLFGVRGLREVRNV